jgi:CoA:oxalate CoA-transferase
MAPKALDNLKILEYAREVSGPYCGKLFADMGAEVIKIEPPQGDPSRLYGPFPNDQAHPEKSALFLYLNTNKKGVTLDLEQSKDRKQFEKLVQYTRGWWLPKGCIIDLCQLIESCDGMATEFASSLKSGIH